MKYIKILGLCLIAVTAISALASASASAKLPEWGKCQVTEGIGGKYTDANCIEKAKRVKGVYQGGYEWTQLEKIHAIPIALQGGLTFETASGAKIECDTMDPKAAGFGGADESEIVLEGPSQAKTAYWEFFGCHSEGIEEGHECRNTVVNGVISTLFSRLGEPYEDEEGNLLPFYHGWKGQLGFIEGKGSTSPAVGLSYTPNNNSRAFLEAVGQRTERFIDPPIVCESEIGTVWIGGERHGGNSVISALQPVNQMSSEFNQVYSSSAPGMQSPTKFEGNKPHTLQAFIHNHWEPVAIEATMTWQLEEGKNKIEIKATK